jgi:hypothetical protein
VEEVRWILIAFAAISCSVTTAFACWQTDWPRVELATQSVNLRVTYNDKAQSGRTFQLHEATTRHPTQTPPEQYYEKKVLKSAVTDSQGLASFGKVLPRFYWITGGANAIALTVVPPTRRYAKRMWVKEFDDGCINAVAEKAD